MAMALNALLVDPGRVWQGVWRWYDESMLDNCESHEVMKLKGITLAKLACVGRCNRADVTLHYGTERSLDAFRRDVIAACSHAEASTSGATPPVPVPGGNGTDTTSNPQSNSTCAQQLERFIRCCASRSVLILSYNRATLGQTGTGHFSPVGGYHAASDSVLVMDVARFKYSPHWVPLPLLHAAMVPEDPEAGRPRGYLVVRSTAELVRNCCCGSGIGSGGCLPMDEGVRLGLVDAEIPAECVRTPGAGLALGICCSTGATAVSKGDQGGERVDGTTSSSNSDSSCNGCNGGTDVDSGDADDSRTSTDDQPVRKRQRSVAEQCQDDLQSLLQHVCEHCSDCSAGDCGRGSGSGSKSSCGGMAVASCCQK